MSLKRSLLTCFAPLLLVVLLVAACGNSSTTTASGGSTPTAAPTTPSAPAVVKTATATVDGKSETILTDAQGMTLYIRTSDTATKVCTGACAQAWPPLLFNGSGTPTSATSLSGTLSVSSNVNGVQVEYQGHPLYTFASDKAPGQVKGQKLGGVWFVATPDLQPMGGSPSTSPTPYKPGY